MCLPAPRCAVSAVFFIARSLPMQNGKTHARQAEKTASSGWGPLSGHCAVGKLTGSLTADMRDDHDDLT